MQTSEGNLSRVDFQMQLEMIKIYRVIFFCLSLVVAFCLPVKAEIKGIWIRPLIGARIEVREDETKTRRFIAEELNRIGRAGLNTIFVETFWDGYTIYPSKLAPQRPLSIEYGTAKERGKNFDVLAIYLDEAGKRNLKVHAWLHIFHQWNTNLGELKKSPIFSKNPDWAVLDETGSPYVFSEAEGEKREIYKVFLSPANPGARKFLGNIVRELAENYPRLAGAQWDYIRYPLHDSRQKFDFSQSLLELFQKKTGLNARNLKTEAERKIWLDWKTGQVSETVESFNRIVGKIRPGWDISVAVFPDFENTLKVKMQDSRAWARAGWIGTIYPMLYSPKYETVDFWAQEFQREIPQKTRVNAAIYISHFYDSKTGKIDERYLAIQSKHKFDGVAFFASQLLTDDLIEKMNGNR